MNDFLKRFGTSSILGGSSILEESSIFDVEMVPTPYHAINVALSGELNGGFRSGILTIAGPSRHFKTFYGLVMVKAYLEKYEDSYCFFYDSEWGASNSYWESLGIDTSRVLRLEITNIEEFKFDLVEKLEKIKKGERFIIFVDSIGNLASKKEVDDAKDQKSVADMTRAKALKSLFRIITPMVNSKSIPMIVINHVYMEQGMFPRTIVSGGAGVYYSANDIWIIGKSQIKSSDGLEGFNFNINIEKSRSVKEKSVIPFQVGFDEGMNPFSGVFDIGLKCGFIESPSKGWYSFKGSDEKFRRKTAEEDEDFMRKLVQNEEFNEMVKKEFKL